MSSPRVPARIAALVGLLVFAVRPVRATAPPSAARAEADSLVRVAADVELHQVAPDVWRTVTWADVPPYGRTPANGLLVISGREALLVNTTWTDTEAGALADWVERCVPG